MLFRYDKVEAILSPFRHLFDWPMLVIFAVILLVAGVMMLLLPHEEGLLRARIV